MIGGLADHEDAIARSVGYRNAMNEAGLKVDRELLVEGDFSAESGVRAADQLLQDLIHFTAIFSERPYCFRSQARAL